MEFLMAGGRLLGETIPKTREEFVRRHSEHLASYIDKLGSFRKTFAVPPHRCRAYRNHWFFSHWLRSVKAPHGALNCHPATHRDAALASPSRRRLPSSLKLQVFHPLASFRNFFAPVASSTIVSNSRIARRRRARARCS